MKNSVLLTFFVVFLSNSLFAQDIKGVEAFSKISHSSIIELFGTPDSVTNFVSDFADGTQSCIEYKYGNNTFSIVDGELDGFYVSSPDIPVLVNYIQGGVIVGDPISKISHLKPLKKNGDDFYILFYNSDFPLYIGENNGIITYFNFFGSY